MIDTSILLSKEFSSPPHISWHPPAGEMENPQGSLRFSKCISWHLYHYHKVTHSDGFRTSVTVCCHFPSSRFCSTVGSTKSTYTLSKSELNTLFSVQKCFKLGISAVKIPKKKLKSSGFKKKKKTLTPFCLQSCLNSTWH